MSQFLRSDEVIFTGTHDECVAFAKEWGYLQWVESFHCWLLIGDCGIV